MEKQHHQLRLPNGLTVTFTDRTRRYFGDYHQVNVEVECTVAVPSNHEARAVLGSAVTYRRTLTRMGIPSSRLDETLSDLVAKFEQTSLAYLSSPTFAEKFIRSELLKRGKKVLPLTRTSGF